MRRALALLAAVGVLSLPRQTFDAPPASAATVDILGMPVEEQDAPAVVAYLTAVADERESQPALDWWLWSALAECESGGRWDLDVGVFDGGLQFHPSTWAAYGGLRFAPRASEATMGQQIAVARRVLEGQGWRAWPGCSAKLRLSA